MLLADRIRTARNPSVELRRIKRQLNEGAVTDLDVKAAASHLNEGGDPAAADALLGVLKERAKPLAGSKAADHRRHLRVLNDGAMKGDHLQRAILNVLIDILEALEKK